jgi:hypothetical protein
MSYEELRALLRLAQWIVDIEGDRASNLVEDADYEA